MPALPVLPPLDPALLVAAAVLFLAGLVRGFAGFGAAMVFVPVAAALYEPALAVAVIYLVDGIASVPLAVPAVRRCVWREVLALAGGAALTVPAGAWLLVNVEPTPLRWAISLLILVAVAALGSGWRYRRPPGLKTTVAVGAASGLAGGLAALYGPPVILFWLGGQGAAAQVRANIITFFLLTTVISGIAYLTQGLFTAERLGMAAVLLPLYLAGIYSGARSFRFASETFFRRLALGLCAAVAVVSLPLWERL
jgi:uncharacterized membrane protein YfcA